MAPDNRLEPRFNTSSSARLPSSGGISPISALPANSIVHRRANAPHFAGIGPASPLPESFSRRRCSSSTMAGGRRPPCSNGATTGSSSFVTRPGEPVTPTPIHSSTGTFAVQFVATHPNSSSRSPTSTSQSRTSPGFDAGEGTTTPARHASRVATGPVGACCALSATNPSRSRTTTHARCRWLTASTLSTAESASGWLPTVWARAGAVVDRDPRAVRGPYGRAPRIATEAAGP